MPRRPKYPSLRVYLDNRLVGHWRKAPSGVIAFHYDPTWLADEEALPVSLSLPLREEPYRGAAVVAVFENLLPDSPALRGRVAERVGADGADVYSLLASIGRDCVGALQFVAGDEDIIADAGINGDPVDDADIERMLERLDLAPLGLDHDESFRISVAGAQEKTALLWHQGRWLKPHGTTPTTHILKPQIGRLPNGIDLGNSVENEYYCLKLAEAFGLSANSARIVRFGATRALVVERFDRRWTSDGRLLRLPQEDCCQALSVPPARKYESEGGPGMRNILDLLAASDDPAEDQKAFLLRQMFFWLIGATDGHAKNFSIFLGRGGRFRLTPLYDVLTAQPSLDHGEIGRNQMRLAMCVGQNRHYRIDEIHPRHFLQTARMAKVPPSLVRSAMEHIVARAAGAFDAVACDLGDGCPQQIHDSVRAAALPRIEAIEAFVQHFEH